MPWRFKVFLGWNDAEQSWVSYVPVLDYLCTHGDSKEEVLQRTREAIEGHLAALEKMDGAALDPAERVAKGDEISEEEQREDRIWLDADVGGLLPPYEWGPEGPPQGKPVHYIPGKGVLIFDEEVELAEKAAESPPDGE